MISLLGDYYYIFPEKIPLKLKLKDMLDKDVDEKSYIQLSEKIECSQFVNVERERDREPVARTVRTSGRSSTDRHSWDIIIEQRKET